MRLIKDLIAYEAIHPDDWPGVKEWLIEIEAEELDDGSYLANRFLFRQEPMLKLLSQSELGH